MRGSSIRSVPVQTEDTVVTLKPDGPQSNVGSSRGLIENPTEEGTTATEGKEDKEKKGEKGNKEEQGADKSALDKSKGNSEDEEKVVVEKRNQEWITGVVFDSPELFSDADPSKAEDASQDKNESKEGSQTTSTKREDEEPICKPIGEWGVSDVISYLESKGIDFCSEAFSQYVFFFVAKKNLDNESKQKFPIISKILFFVVYFFFREEITGPVFMVLTDADLKEFSFTMGKRKMVLIERDNLKACGR
jgi:hypothetical protein